MRPSPIDAPAIKHAVATAAAGIKPTEGELAAAMAEGADIVLGLFADVQRCAVALEQLASWATKPTLFDADTALAEAIDRDRQ